MCPKGRWWLQQGAAGRCLRAGTSVPALQGGYAGCVEGEGCTSWGWQQQPCSTSVCGSPRRDLALGEAESVPYSCWIGTFSVLISVLHGSVRTLWELGLSYIEYRACGKSVVLELCSEKIPSRDEGTLPMQPTQRIGPCLDEFRLRKGCSGVHPLLWLKQISQIWLESLPSQTRAIRGTIHFVLSVPFFSTTFKKVTVQVNSCPGSSAIEKKEAFLLHVLTAQWQFNFLFSFVSIQMWNRLREFKITHCSTKKRHILFSKGKHSTLMLFLQRIRKEWWQNFLLLRIFIFHFYLCLSA